MRNEHTTVLIAGGGLVGLSAAAFLSWHGVPVVLVERRSGTLIHPRARTINPRSVEVYRQIGLEQAILDARSYVGHASSLLFRAETLAGPERFRSALEPPESIDDLSPCPWAPIDQDKLELVLQRRATELGADIRFSTELRSFEQDGDGVTAVVADHEAGGERTVHARYLVAADGHRGFIRERLGISSHGIGTLGHTMTLVFEADLSGPLRGRRLGVCHLDRPAVGTVLLPHEGDRRWVFSAPYQPDKGEALASFTDRRSVAMIREAIGVPDLEVRIVPQLPDGTKVLAYELGARVADRFRQGRVLLAGDTAHSMPPTGALGASTGIQDAHNLAWKLAAVLRGQAGPRLLDSYDAERRPVAELTVDQAMLQLRNRTRPGPASQQVFSAVDYYAVVFGYRYRAGAVVPEAGGDDDGAVALPPRELGGQPGTRAPHLVLRHRRRPLSALDLYGRGLVLLAGPEGGAWVEAIGGLAGRLGIELRGYRLGTDLLDQEDRWAGAYGATPSGAVLVRPDGFVAWRARAAGAEPPERVLGRVLGRLLDVDLPLTADTLEG